MDTMKRNLIVGATGCIVVVAIALGFFYGKEQPQASAITYQNPVFEPVLADPSVIKADDGYVYAYGTEDDWGDGEGSRLVPVIRSKNMVNWDYVGEAFTEKPSWKDGGVWAPDVSYFNGKYYMYYTLSVWGDQNPGIGLAVSDSPTGPFEDVGEVLSSDDMEAYSIDPMLFVDDGTPYLFFGGITSGIFGIELSKDGRETIGEKFQIVGTGYEAPFVIKRDNYYYFFGSAGACCEGADSTYRVGVARSESLKGPYLNQNGADVMYEEGNVILTGYFPPDNDKQRFVGPGHNSVITDDKGTDWIVYHAIDVNYPKFGHGATRRPLMIDEIIWKDGWPSLEGLFPSTEAKDGPVFNNK